MIFISIDVLASAGSTMQSFHFRKHLISGLKNSGPLHINFLD